MKNNPLHEIDKMFNDFDVSVVRVSNKQFDELLKTYPDYLRARYMTTGIERKPGKFIKSNGMK